MQKINDGVITKINVQLKAKNPNKFTFPPINLGKIIKSRNPVKQRSSLDSSYQIPRQPKILTSSSALMPSHYNLR